MSLDLGDATALIANTPARETNHKKNSIRLAAALVAAFILAAQIPASAEPTKYTILDQYTGRVPTGTSYQQLTYYTQYVDAGSVDASPFVINLLTSPRQNGTGILFYGSTELNSRDRANTFRLTSTTGLFDFTSFNLQELEPYVDEPTATSIPTITITSSTGFSETFSATVESEELFPGFFDYSYRFFDTGIKEMDWLGVEWVDFTTQYTKAKTSDFSMTLSSAPAPVPGPLPLFGVAAAFGFSRKLRKRIQLSRLSAGYHQPQA